MSLLYLASPYSHPDKEVMEQRFSEVCVIAGRLMMSGLVVFCPIAHGHPIAARSELPTDWDYWKQFCHEFIAASSKVVVAMMDGWQESRGVAAEVAIAKELGIPVEYMRTMIEPQTIDRPQ